MYHHGVTAPPPGDPPEAPVIALGIGALIPRLTDGVDPRALQLDAPQARVLAEIDGRRSVDEICRALPFPASETVDLLNLLCIGGAILLPDAPSAPRRNTLPFTPTNQRPAKRITQAMNVGALRARQRIPTPTGPFRLGDGGLEIDHDPRRRVAEALALAAQGDAEMLLGVDRGADEQAVRRAYFRRAKEFHPDRYFGRQLGPYRVRLQRLFAALAEAYHRLQRERRPG